MRLVVISAWCVYAHSLTPPEASCENAVEEEDASSLLQLSGAATGISPRTKPAAQVGCPQCKGQCMQQKACEAGLTIHQFCAQNPDFRGCEIANDKDTAHCCFDFTTECRACQAKMSVPDYCMTTLSKCNQYENDCVPIIKPFCLSLPKDTDFSPMGHLGLPGHHEYCVCRNFVAPPYDGPVKIDASTCPQHVGKQLYHHPYNDDTERSLQEALESCVEYGEKCVGVTCLGPSPWSKGKGPRCTPRIGTAGLSSCHKSFPGCDVTYSVLKAECKDKKDKKKMMKGMKGKGMKKMKK